jgi:16S rRNA (adenine1518-N6/adenine1519-N6)-dimethyltransferase
MPIYKPTELILFLESLGHHPKKALSQNFLIDGNIIRKIVSTAGVQPDELILEIGPGPGSLTEALLNTGARVLAVEKDNALAEALQRFQKEGKLTILCDDVLAVPLEKYLPLNKKTKVIANLPYNIATAIILEFIVKRDLISSIFVMVQEEVARRMTAHPSSKEYGSLTLFLNFYAETKYLFTVSKNCFFPVPKVQSAVVELRLREPPPVMDKGLFFEMTRTAFEQRRKMLRNSLRDLYGMQKVEHALEKIGKNPTSRPEELSLEEFLALFAQLQSN